MAKHKHVLNRDFTAMSFLWRLVACLILVLLTFNPSGYSAYHWVVNAITESHFGPIHAITVILFIIGWAIVLVASWRALDAFGLIILSLALAAFVWLLIDLGLFKPQSISAYAWIVLVCLAIVLAVGMCWSHIWRRLTGQLSVDDVDE